MKPDELKKRRIQMGLSQTKFGRLLGLSLRTILRYEHGRGEIPLAVQMALDSLGTNALSTSVPKIRSVRKGSNRKVTALRSSEYQRWRIDPDREQLRRDLHLLRLGIALGCFAADGR